MIDTSLTFSFIMQERSSGEGEPTTFRMWFNWSRSAHLVRVSTTKPRHTMQMLHTHTHTHTCVCTHSGLGYNVFLEKLGDWRASRQGCTLLTKYQLQSKSGSSFLYACRQIFTRLGVSFGVKHNFRSSVPACCHILCQKSSVVVCRISNSG